MARRSTQELIRLHRFQDSHIPSPASMACTLSSAVASTAGLTSTTVSSSPKTMKLHTPCLVRAVQVPGNGAQKGGGEPPLQRQSLQQSRRPRDSSLLLLDSWDPFSRGGLRQMMNTVDRLFLDDVASSRSNGSRTSSRAAMSSGVRAPWDVVEDEEGFHIRVDMPGFAKEDVKVSIEDGILVVSGERDPSKEDPRWAAKSYSNFNTRLALPDNVHLDKISAELKNGVLFVGVPKVKPEDRKQVFSVQIS